MATENRRVATTATETPAETPSLAVATETPSLVVATETPPVATTGTETPLVVATETPPLAVATETPLVATTATETPPAAETPPLVVATETPPLVMATETPPVATTATETPLVATTATENAPLGDILFVLVSIIPALVTGYFLFKTLSLLRRGDPDCTNPHLEWDLGFYIFLVVIFMVASIGVLFRVIAIQVPGIILLLVTSISILVTSWSVQLGGDPYKNHMRIEEVYRLEGYAPWAQKFLLQDRGWKDFQNCLIERKICDKVQKIRGFYQEGCCIPPPYCGYEDRNQTWVIPKTGRYMDNVNCIRWDGDKRKCYDCETCQAVYMNTMDFTWTLRALLLIFGWGVLGAFLMLTVAINATSKIKGATKEQIERLPKYKFLKTGEFENQNGENQESFGGIMRKCGTDAPIERVLSLKDAECCICLCAYVDGTELRELPCSHHFHCSCIDTWLHIKATCPLCKFNALKNGNRSGSEEV